MERNYEVKWSGLNQKKEPYAGVLDVKADRLSSAIKVVSDTLRLFAQYGLAITSIVIHRAK